MRCFYVVLLLMIVSIGCSTTSDGKTVQGDRYLILAEEIERSSRRVTTAYDVIKALRPTLLDIFSRNNISLRINEGIKPVQDSVYLNGAFMGNVRSLADITAESIAKIQYLRPSEAGSRYGLATKGGEVFQITTK